MKGVYFLPTLSTLQNWLQRANFKDFEVLFNEELSTEEQRATEWAPVRSLNESLDPDDNTKTIEGYPRAHRFYVKVRR
jgi:tRNA (mo5U34)-methyltransferase